MPLAGCSSMDRTRTASTPSSMSSAGVCSGSTGVTIVSRDHVFQSSDPEVQAFPDLNLTNAIAIFFTTHPRLDNNTPVDPPALILTLHPRAGESTVTTGDYPLAPTDELDVGAASATILRPEPGFTNLVPPADDVGSLKVHALVAGHGVGAHVCGTLAGLASDTNPQDPSGRARAGASYLYSISGSFDVVVRH